MSKAIHFRLERISVGLRHFIGPFAIVLSASSLLAHSDPKGDVYPNVRIERGNFVIDFENNVSGFTDGLIPSTETDGRDRELLRMVYLPDGVLLAPRHLHGGSRDLDDAMGSTAKTRSRVGDETIEVTLWSKGQLSYTSENSGKTQLHRLAWPTDDERKFEAVSADASSICIAFISNSMLFLGDFDRQTFSPPKTVQVTKPDTLPFIWDFPVVSNLVRVGERYCIAWPRYNKGAEKFQCIISTWKPGEDQTKEIVLDEPADWNSHLSMAAIGTHLCLSYHALAGEYQPISKIITVFRTILD